MRTACALAALLSLAGCAMTDGQIHAEIMGYVDQCNKMGYRGPDERRCVENLVDQSNAREAAFARSLSPSARRSRPINTRCYQDALGAIVCSGGGSEARCSADAAGGVNCASK